MQYKKLGRTGLYVSRLCLGTMNFGDCTDKKSAFEIMDRATDLGINFIDTAQYYRTYPYIRRALEVMRLVTEENPRGTDNLSTEENSCGAVVPVSSENLCGAKRQAQ